MQAEKTPRLQWFRVIDHAAERGRKHAVRHGATGEPFRAWLDQDNQWFEVNPDVDGDGTEELGQKIGVTLDLQWRGVLKDGKPTPVPTINEDFERLLQGNVKLQEMEPAKIAAVKHRFSVHAAAGKSPDTFDLDAAIAAIQDPRTRETIAKWNRYFP